MILNRELFREVYRQNALKGFHEDDNDPNKKPTLLILTISEVSEALEAIRKGKLANRKAFEQNEPDVAFAINFVDHIKDSFEDELADVVIRLYDFAGMVSPNFVGIKSEYEKELFAWQNIKIHSIPAYLFSLAKCITSLHYSGIAKAKIGEAIAKVEYLCIHEGIDLEWHTQKKMEYNKTRPFKHGKIF